VTITQTGQVPHAPVASVAKARDAAATGAGPEPIGCGADATIAAGKGDDVPWLSLDQQAAWRSYLTGVARLADVLNRQLERDAGLSLSEYEVLVRLSEAPGRTLRMAELAASLVHSRSRLTHAVSRLESRGLVDRVAGEADGRGINAVLTEHGWQTLVDAAPGHVSAVREHLVDRLTGEQLAALGEAMARIATEPDP
jgi:DNA-binding MarR family transcriptional regulator